MRRYRRNRRAGLHVFSLPLCPFFFIVERYGEVFTVPLMGINFTYLIGPEAQASFYKLNVRETADDRQTGGQRELRGKKHGLGEVVPLG